MSSRWVPKWEVRKVKVNQREEDVCFDPETKMFACPRCSPVCLNGGLPDSGSYFFNEKDLVEHLLAHKYSLWTKRRAQEKDAEEEEEVESSEE